MGYYSLDPLGRGFFRIDPAATLPPEALAFYSETQSFNAFGFGSGIKKAIQKLVKETVERATKKVVAEVSEETVEAVGKETVEQVAKESSTEASEQIAKEYPELAAKAARNETGAAGRFQKLVNERSKKLFDEKIVAKETGATTVEQTAKETGETVVEQTAKETGEGAVERVTKYGIKTGVLGGVGFALLSGPVGGLTEVIGNLGDEYTGANCREKAEANYPDAAADELDKKVSECEAKAASRLTTLVGAAGLGIAALGALVVIRLIPKRKSSEQEAQEA